MATTNIADTDFQTKVLQSKTPVLVDFWAPWCGPCRMVGPIIDKLSEKNSDVAVGKMNIDENSKYAAQFGIRAIPTVLFFKDGQLLDKLSGANPEATYQAKLDSLK